jgi:hypothetical protein
VNKRWRRRAPAARPAAIDDLLAITNCPPRDLLIRGK